MMLATHLLWAYTLEPTRYRVGGESYPTSRLSRKLVAATTSEEALTAARRLLDVDGYATKMERGS